MDDGSKHETEDDVPESESSHLWELSGKRQRMGASSLGKSLVATRLRRRGCGARFAGRNHDPAAYRLCQQLLYWLNSQPRTRQAIMPTRKQPSYETPNSLVVQRRAYTTMSEDAHILEGAGLGPRQNTALQDLIDKVCTLFPAKSGLMT